MEPSTDPAPSIGRIVHFFSRGAETPVPAIICGVHVDRSVDLVLFDPAKGAYVTRAVGKAEPALPSSGGWAWMPHQLRPAQNTHADLADRIAALEAASHAKVPVSIPMLDATGDSSPVE